MVKVSKKGQIVIPAKYRDRLNIDPGMEVQFRIRGHYLLVELNTNVEQEVKYLRVTMKDKLGHLDFDEGGMDEIIRDLISQQFYVGQDMLTDRVGRTQYKIRGADSIVNEVVKLLVHAGRHWLEGKYVETFHEFSEDLELDFASLISRFNNKMRSMAMGGDDMIAMMGGEVVFAMAIGEVLTQFRTRVGDETQERIFKEAVIQGYTSKLGEETVEDAIIARLADKYSILMNLRVLREMARVSINSIGVRKFEKISGSLLDELTELEMPFHIRRRIERRKKRVEKKQQDIAMGITPADDDDDDEFDDSEMEMVMPSTDDESKEEIESELEMDIPSMPDFD
ncbi:MAG: AbrB/MazE/SpoVT family DNA-binding domain-containing protein [Candidatus Heimdallarchaeota archaeon]|nr:AbrB/MazE/SpoVT family DNA-binding domain-containing protein [Candidatus Heimdallarchaeota archaeon]